MIFFFCIFSLYGYLNIFLENRNECGVGLEILLTLSKLIPNLLQTHMVSFFLFLLHCQLCQLIIFLFSIRRNEFSCFPLSSLCCFLLSEKGMSLEVLQSLSNLDSSSLVSCFLLIIIRLSCFWLTILKKEWVWKCGVGLEIRHTQLNFAHTHTYFPFEVIEVVKTKSSQTCLHIRSESDSDYACLKSNNTKSLNKAIQRQGLKFSKASVCEFGSPPQNPHCHQTNFSPKSEINSSESDLGKVWFKIQLFIDDRKRS